jgi:regulator of protease activity HflC (stomatin/prohibitin superfamily)
LQSEVVVMIKEREVHAPSGLATLVLLLLLLFGLLGGIIAGGAMKQAAIVAPSAVGFAVVFVLLFGFFMVAPNEGRVLQLFGRYVGTCRDEGLRWANPFYSKKRLSLRVRNFETARLKVNDLEGNPIEIGAVVVWKVVDTAEAAFHVDDYEKFVHVQSEAALRNLATRYPYDAHDDQHPSLRGHAQTIATELRDEIQKRLAQAGVSVVEARISHLAYAPEIIAARQRIVEGAVGMVEMALHKLAERNVVDLDPERKAQMVSNLLVVLCGERGTQPVVNTGTIYQ